jgi:hypothetical protein
MWAEDSNAMVAQGTKEEIGLAFGKIAVVVG